MPLPDVVPLDVFRLTMTHPYQDGYWHHVWHVAIAGVYTPAQVMGNGLGFFADVWPEGEFGALWTQPFTTTAWLAECVWGKNIGWTFGDTAWLKRPTHGADGGYLPTVLCARLSLKATADGVTRIGYKYVDLNIADYWYGTKSGVNWYWEDKFQKEFDEWRVTHNYNGATYNFDIQPVLWLKKRRKALYYVDYCLERTISVLRRRNIIIPGGWRHDL